MITNNVVDELSRRIKQDLTLYDSFQGILNKAEKDGSFYKLIDCIQSTVKNEIDFAIKGRINRAKQV